MVDPHELRSLARDGLVRAATFTGDRMLVQHDGDDLRGVGPTLAHRLARRSARDWTL